MCIRYPGFFALRALKSFDRIVFLEIALYSMCKLKRFKKGTDGFSTLQSNRIFPFTNTIFISVKIGIATSIFPEFVSYNGNPLLKFICKFEQLISFITVWDHHIITMNLLYYEIPDLGRIPSSASLSFCSSSFFFLEKFSQKSVSALAWIGMRSSLVKVSLPDSSKAFWKWLPNPSPIIIMIISVDMAIWIFVICIVE